MNIEKEKRAIEYLKSFEPEEGYYLCYSGGKDSDVILTLAQLAGVKFDAHHNLTTVDAPETVRYIKQNPLIKIDTPEKSMWKLIEEFRYLPTRMVRYCCKELKEKGGKGRLTVTGVRKAESIARAKNGGLVKIIGKPKTTQKLAEEMNVDYDITEKKGLVLNLDNDNSRRFVEHCYRTITSLLNPILDWTDEDVWDFLIYYNIEVNPLYEAKIKNGCLCPTGQSRVGCIGCPLKSDKERKKDFIKYPKYRDMYLRAIEKMLKKRNEIGDPFRNGKTPEEVLMWWVGDDPRQIRFDKPEYLK